MAAIGSLLKAYAEEHALLNPKETRLLNEALQVLGNLGAAADEAKDRVNRSAKKIFTGDQARDTAAARSATSEFSSIPIVDAILLLCHLHGNSGCFKLREIKGAKPGLIRSDAFRRDVMDVQRVAVREVEYKIRKSMIPGNPSQAPAAEAAAATRAEFEAARESLQAIYAKQIEQAVTCMTAATLDQTK